MTSSYTTRKYTARTPLYIHICSRLDTKFSDTFLVFSKVSPSSGALLAPTNKWIVPEDKSNSNEASPPPIVSGRSRHWSRCPFRKSARAYGKAHFFGDHPVDNGNNWFQHVLFHKQDFFIRDRIKVRQFWKYILNDQAFIIQSIS